MANNCGVFNILSAVASLQALVLGCAIVAASFGFFKGTTYGQIIEGTILFLITYVSFFYYDARYEECIKAECVFKRELGD
jgi:hypothetical protein